MRGQRLRGVGGEGDACTVPERSVQSVTSCAQGTSGSEDALLTKLSLWFPALLLRCHMALRPGLFRAPGGDRSDGGRGGGDKQRACVTPHSQNTNPTHPPPPSLTAVIIPAKC